MLSKKDQTVLVNDEGPVRTITLNRPEVLNAFDEDLIAALGEAVSQAAEDGVVRCVLITGAGRAFSSGQDLAELTRRYEAGDPIDLESRLRDGYNPIIARLREMAKPVVAAVNGTAAGAGFSLALAGDLRIAAESASFIQAFVKVGLVPDCGSTYFLPQLVGPARAADLAFTGRRVSAAEAQEMGLVTRVVADADLPGEAIQLARELASLPTRAIGLIKRALHAAWTADLKGQLDYEAQLQAAASQTQDHREGVAAFMAKRLPRFVGR
jgi:2-(1,2-epoxy-1,2-dihydrophenyl)acetyl-CoA isomerase